MANYYFGINPFKDGVAYVQWTLQPDGRYYADSDGFGMTDDDEINVYAFIDKGAHILVRPKGECSVQPNTRPATRSPFCEQRKTDQSLTAYYRENYGAIKRFVRFCEHETEHPYYLCS